MPWPEVNVVELRLQFVLRTLSHDLPFSALCAEYGISPKTGYKWQERFPRKGAAGGSLRQQQAALEVWRREFNQERPHEALGQRLPAEVYQRSPRRFDPRPLDLEYPAGYFRRKVNQIGWIKLANRAVRISVALSGWHVGLQLLGPERFRVWFVALPLGEINLLDEKFIPARQ